MKDYLSKQSPIFDRSSVNGFSVSSGKSSVLIKLEGRRTMTPYQLQLSPLSPSFRENELRLN
jgi:hypothetical protein